MTLTYLGAKAVEPLLLVVPVPPLPEVPEPPLVIEPLNE
jgi:hypothetical protein